MQNLFNSGDYSWSLFVGHLVIEQLLKALSYKKTGSIPIGTHDLLELSNCINLNLNEEQKTILFKISSFNISGRDPKQELEFYKKATRNYTSYYLRKIKELRPWLKNRLIN